MFSAILMVCLYLASSNVAFTIDSDHQSTPVVGDWQDAVNANGLMRIPLRNPHGHSWFLALRMGTPLQTEGLCVLGTNHALSVVFSATCRTCPGARYNSHRSSTFYATQQKNVTSLSDDGFTVSGYLAMDYMCLGMYGNEA